MKLLVKNADVLVTMDGDRRELKGGCLLVEDGVITSVGPEMPADEILDATGCVVTPGLVNTHHHLYQSLTRVVPGGQDALLFGWLQTLYPIWAKMRPEHMKISAQVGLAELALSGCTMSSDHLYLYPNGVQLEDTIEAAQSLGMRFHPTRGSMSIGESDGGLPPDSLVEREADILEDSIRLVDKWHDAAEGSMLRIGLAPCSPFSVSRELMRDSALLARDKGVMLHTHLAENDEDIAYSLEKFGCRPGEYAQELGWVGEDVWHAHCVKLDVNEIDLFAATGTGVAHCPCSNCRLGSGIAPVRAMRDAGVKVGLGVDGSASNDVGDIISEARQMMLLQRVQNGADAFSAREALEVATLGGAQVLGRPDCGSLEIGKRADFAVWDVRTLANAGAWDSVAALVLCGPQRVRDLYVEGRAVVREGQISRLDMPVIAEQARALAAGLA
ncbi:MAG: 8-oxoguanine deaminase [Rhodobacteraceae bacterium]|nr:8-oxoguanine deaminase [Paracoccaceae bacterium]